MSLDPFNKDQPGLIISGLEPHEESFTSEKAGCFNVSRARAWANANVEATDANIRVVDILQMTAKDKNLDSRLMAELLKKDLPELLRTTVLLYIQWNDGRHLLIDGHHRMAAIGLHAMGACMKEVSVRAQAIPYAKRDRFRVDYHEIMPDGSLRPVAPIEILNAISGIYCNRDGSIRDEREGVTS